MAPRVLYHCTCKFGVLSTGDGRPHEGHSKPGESSSAPTPSLPSQTRSARYSFHPLSHLYFCGDCLTPRCHLCAQSEIITHYCPSCLFEVPSASVKAERSRCPRNCFVCPVEGCGSYLSVWATDPKNVTRLESIDASVGQPPYFLICLQCKWDSKRGMRGGRGYVFEKPTGLSTQMASQQGTHPGQLEMDKLRSHFESYLRKQSTSSSSSLPTSSSYSALGRSKLLRDVPGLEDSKYLTGGRSGAKNANRPSGEEAMDNFHSDYSPVAGAVPADEGKTYKGDEYGIMGQREENNRQWIRSLTGFESSAISGVQERWRTGWDAGPRANTLDPLRVPLRTKVTLRCPACRHILVKPDPKATSYRWKIKLSALSYLPEIATTFKGIKGEMNVGADANGPSSTIATGSTLTRRTSTLGLRGAARPQSMFLSSSSSPLVLDSEKLSKGKTYEYELSFKNPLEDPIAVHLTLVCPSNTPGRILLSTTRFTVKPFDDVGIIDEELLSDPRRSGGEEDDGAPADEGQDYEEAFVSATTTTTSRHRRRKGWEKGVLRKQSNETVIALRLDLTARSQEEQEVVNSSSSSNVEFALLTTFTYHMDSASEDAGDGHTSASNRERSLDFWTAVRLGRVVS